MKKLIIKIICCTLFVLLSVRVYPQDQNFDRNAIYGSLGSLLVFNTATIYYERTLTDVDLNWVKEKRNQTVTKQTRLATFARIGYGGSYSIMDDKGKHVMTQLGFLVGTRSSFLEGTAGVAYNTNWFFGGTNILPTWNVGYRLQRHESPLIFRVGVGFPEMVNLGIGVSF